MKSKGRQRKERKNVCFHVENCGQEAIERKWFETRRSMAWTQESHNHEAKYLLKASLNIVLKRGSTKLDEYIQMFDSTLNQFVELLPTTFSL